MMVALTILAAIFIAQHTSFCKVALLAMNCFLLIWLMSALNLLKLSRKSVLLLFKEKAEDVYKCDISL
jgi:hypothetical protein